MSNYSSSSSDQAAATSSSSSTSERARIPQHQHHQYNHHLWSSSAKPSRNTSPPRPPRSSSPPLYHLNTLTESSSRLNSMIEITQNLFVCGTPRRRGNSCGGSAYQYRHYTHHPDLESAASLCQSQSQHHFQWNPNVLLMEDEQEEGECAGIEIDTENSLKAAYELYRV